MDFLVVVAIASLAALVVLLLAILVTGAGRLWQFTWVARLQNDYLTERLKNEREDRDDWKARYFAELDRRRP
jgi:hypothetical protein